MAIRTEVPKGKIEFGASVVCGEKGCLTIVSNLFESSEAIIARLRDSGWTWDQKRGWVCSVCNYSAKKKKEAQEKAESGDVPF